MKKIISKHPPNKYPIKLFYNGTKYNQTIQFKKK
jgi:hypothetical protein